eukprot:gene15694-biopygen17199
MGSAPPSTLIAGLILQCCMYVAVQCRVAVPCRWTDCYVTGGECMCPVLLQFDAGDPQPQHTDVLDSCVCEYVPIPRRCSIASQAERFCAAFAVAMLCLGWGGPFWACRVVASCQKRTPFIPRPPSPPPPPPPPPPPASPHPHHHRLHFHLHHVVHCAELLLTIPCCCAQTRRIHCILRWREVGSKVRQLRVVPQGDLRIAFWDR